MRSQRAAGAARPRWNTGADASSAHDVVALEVAVGEREQAEQPAPEHAVGERADGGAVVRRCPAASSCSCTRRAYGSGAP